ncbi:class I SAM-dependent methyltransferase [Alphaproteobacteria bacterium]|jgi:SAM-dependent methyltransferase|nr:class I SAM-dependent methyltransferase [Alphaproteobacteria bacterium]
MISILSKNHNKTKRNYIERMLNDKVQCMIEAKKYGKNYWDGDRKYGYGGFKYISGLNDKIANALIKKYSLIGKKKILDIGCGKGFLLNDLFIKNQYLDIFGIDISNYAKKFSKIPNKKNFYIKDLERNKKLPFKNKFFDLVISSGSLHNLSLKSLIINLKEIDRVSKKSIIMIESYRNEKELFNLQCWALTCKSFLSVKDWKYLINEYSPKSDLEFIFFK